MIQGRPVAETPREVADLRRKLLNWWTRTDTAEMFVHRKYPDEGEGFDDWLAAHQSTVLREGEVFFVSDEMTEIARSAAQTLTSFTLELEDLPAEMGLLVFHHPCATQFPAHGEVSERADIVAMTWWHGVDSNGDAGVWFCQYEDRDQGTLVNVDDETATRTANQKLLPKLLLERWAVARLGAPWNTSNVAGLPATISALLLMQQPLAVRERAALPHADRRRAVRAHIADPGITVVTLRHQSTNGNDHVVRPADWRHRWIVRGHWRNQWLPSRGTHRPIWVNAHIKGPDHLPLKVSEKIHVWSR